MNKLSLGLNGSYIIRMRKCLWQRLPPDRNWKGPPWIANFDLSHNFTKELISSIHWYSIMSAIRFIPSVHKVIKDMDGEWWHLIFVRKPNSTSMSHLRWKPAICWIPLISWAAKPKRKREKVVLSDYKRNKYQSGSVVHILNRIMK